MLQVYKASAGSGKTFNLAKEYIKILLAVKNPDGTYRLRPTTGRPHEHVLAITFTNKATDEMTARIIKELAILAENPAAFKGKRSDYHDDYVREFGCTHDELVEAARYALFTLLSDYNYFNVSTIDSFFQNVLRIFARELEMPDNFELELDDKYTLTLGVAEMFRSLDYSHGDGPRRSRSRWIASWIERYMVNHLEEGRQFNMFSRSADMQGDMIASLSRFMDENFKMNSQKIRRYFDDSERIVRFQQSIGKAREAVETRMRDDAAALLPYLTTDVKSTFMTNVSNAATGYFGSKGVDFLTKSYINGIEEPETYFKKGKYDPEVGTRLAEYFLRRTRDTSIYVGLDIIAANVYKLGMLGCVITFIEDYCRDNNLILLSETNNLLRDIISDDETPFIYERLGYYLRHFLIDEFQDTSRMQWENLKPLLMESLSHVENYDNLIIGDEKQCIYRFRNSDPELLGRQVSEEVTARYSDGSVRPRGVDIRDNTNWRSSREVVMFNNSLFTALAYVIDHRDEFEYVTDSRSSSASSQEAARLNRMLIARMTGDDTAGPVSDTYANVVQQVAKSDYKGYVEINFMPDDFSASDEGGDEGGSGLSGDAWCLDNMLRSIDRQLSAGYSPRDIAVLVRSHTEGEKVIDALNDIMVSPDWKHGNFDIISSDAISVGASPSVRLVIAVLRRFTNPLKEVDKNSVTGRDMSMQERINNLHNRYEYYRSEHSADASSALAMALRHERGIFGESDGDVLTDEELSSRAEEAANVGCPSLVSLVERVIRRYLSPAALRRDAAYITALQDIVIDYEARFGSDLRSFLAWWDETGRNTGLGSPEGIDAITVMTIHQSKGLEFKCVHIPFMTQKLYSDSTIYKPSQDWYTIDSDLIPDTVSRECIPEMIPIDNIGKNGMSLLFSAQYRNIVSRRRIDELNVIYVAMTRAVEELIVSVGHSGKKSDEDVEQYIRKAVEVMTAGNIQSGRVLADASKRDWVLPLDTLYDGSQLRLGVPHTHVTCDDKKKNDGDEKTVKMPMPQYQANDRERTIRVDTDELGPFDMRIPRHRGIILHYILQHVETAGDIEMALRRAAQRYSLTAVQTDTCRSIVSRALGSVAARGWFDGFIRALNERPVSDGDEIFRPDRIVWTADGHVDVIDYKFTEHYADEHQKSKVHKRYRRQVTNYCNILRKAGCDGVRGYLWYVDEDRIETV